MILTLSGAGSVVQQDVSLKSQDKVLQNKEWMVPLKDSVLGICLSYPSFSWEKQIIQND